MSTISKPKENTLSYEFDIISNLPDSILSHILCFLPTTKEAVATSILSKRWRYVWTTVEKLVFKAPGGMDVNKHRSFAQFVYGVLKSHQGNIKDLKLRCFKFQCKEFDFTSWINSAIDKGVERLKVTTDYNWPISIFSCKTLVDLKIWGFERRCDNPTTIILPCLKKLHVPFLYFDIEFFNRIVAQCSSLEHLIVDVRHTPIDIESSSMKRLELHFTQPICLDKKIVLGAPSLEYLQIDCTLPTEFVAKERLSSLIEADIYFREISGNLNVSMKQLQDSFFLNFDGHGEFPNLAELEIVSPFFEWRLVVSLMEASINLESITLKKTFTAPMHKSVWREPKIVPDCPSSSFKRISIDGFTGDELPAVKYILRTALVLEQMDIHCADIFMFSDESQYWVTITRIFSIVISVPVMF